MKGVACVAFCAVFLGACSIGIKEDRSNGIRDTFTVPVTYQEAFRRADTFARHCHQSNHFMWKTSFNVTGNLFTDTKTGTVRVNLPNAGRDEEEINVSAINDDLSKVDVTLWGVGIWDQREMEALRDSINTGVPSCR